MESVSKTRYQAPKECWLMKAKVGVEMKDVLVKKLERFSGRKDLNL
jgi:hypothetical protein